MTRLSWSSLVGASILLATLYLFHHTFDDAYQTSILTAGRGPMFFPRIILAAMLLLSLLVIVQGFHERPGTTIPARTVLTMIAVILVTGIYIHAIGTVGFLLSTTAFTFVLPLLLGYRNLPVITVIAAVYPFIIWYVFDRIFLIILPTSPWFKVF